MAGEFDQNGSLTKAYGWEPNSNWTTNPVFMKEGESYYFYHNDHLGTPQKLTAQNGQVVWMAKYTAFGEAVIDPASTITNNLRFPGQYKDEETGLHYNYNRDYDPRSGRYLTPDPIGLEGGDNLFAYVESNPVNFIDFEGLISNSLIFPIPPRPRPCNDEGCRYKGRVIPPQRNPKENPPSNNLKYSPGVIAPNLTVIPLLECMAAKLGRPLIISDGWRPRNVDYGATNSAHHWGQGADIPQENYGGSRNITPCMIREAALACGFTRACFNITYRHMHVDTSERGLRDCNKWGGYIDPCTPCRGIDEI